MKEFEKLIIASVIAEPEAAGLACELVTSDMFTGIERIIFSQINDFNNEGRRIDLFILANALQTELEANGGVTYLTDMTREVVSADRLQDYCLLLKQHHASKLLRNYFVQGVTLCESKEEIQKIIEYAQSGMEEVFNITTSENDGFKHISVIAEKAVVRAEQRVTDRKEGRQIGITSGIRPLDRLTNGWKGSQLIVLAARPAMGKSAMMMHFAKEAAIAGVQVCIYSLEMSDISLADRLLMSVGNFDYDAYKSGEFEQWTELMEAQNFLSHLPIYIDPNPKVSMAYIRNHSRIMKRKGKCEIVLIDYLQLADMTTGEKNRNREQEVSQTTRQAKILSKELDLPIILLSQLSRQTEARADKRPQLSDLRESGAIEQDADIVMFLYRAEYYGITDVKLWDGQMVLSAGIGEIIIAKHREGATGDVAFRYNESMTKITNY